MLEDESVKTIAHLLSKLKEAKEEG